MSNNLLVQCGAIAIFSLLGLPTALAARYVPITITLNGTVIFEGNASDDGTPDADEVWEAVKESNLGPTKAFEDLKIDSSGEEIQLNKQAVIEADGSETVTLIQLHASFGGFVGTHELTLKRVEADGAGRIWRIASEDLDRLFDDRFVRRSDVARLKKR